MSSVFVVKKTDTSEGIFWEVTNVFSSEEAVMRKVEVLNEEFCDYWTDPNDEFSESTKFYEYEEFVLE